MTRGEKDRVICARGREEKRGKRFLKVVHPKLKLILSKVFQMFVLPSFQSNISSINFFHFFTFERITDQVLKGSW